MGNNFNVNLCFIHFRTQHWFISQNVFCNFSRNVASILKSLLILCRSLMLSIRKQTDLIFLLLFGAMSDLPFYNSHTTEAKAMCFFFVNAYYLRYSIPVFFKVFSSNCNFKDNGRMRLVSFVRCGFWISCSCFFCCRFCFYFFSMDAFPNEFMEQQQKHR